MAILSKTAATRTAAQSCGGNVNNQETLGVSEAAAILYAETETVMQFARRGELPGTRIGKSWVFIREDVLDFLRARIVWDTLERRDHYAKAPLAVFIERPKRSRRTPPSPCRVCRKRAMNDYQRRVAKSLPRRLAYRLSICKLRWPVMREIRISDKVVFS